MDVTALRLDSRIERIEKRLDSAVEPVEPTVNADHGFLNSRHSDFEVLHVVLHDHQIGADRAEELDDEDFRFGRHLANITPALAGRNTNFFRSGNFSV